MSSKASREEQQRLALVALLAAGAALLADRLLARLSSRIARRQRARTAAADAGKSALWAPPPHPGWRPPQPQPPPWGASGAFRFVDVAATPPAALYPLIISAVVPRPIAFISTLSGAGVGNLAPYSYFAAVAHDPPHVAIGCCAAADGRPGGHKDTLANILETKEFVVNIVSEWYAEAANHCCGAFPPAADERALAGLGALPSARVRPPRVAEAAVHLECRLAHAYAVRGAGGGVSTTVVIGEVLAVHVAEGAAGASPSGKLVVDLEKLRPLARCGGNTYARVGGLFDLPRPDRAAG